MRARVTRVLAALVLPAVLLAGCAVPDEIETLIGSNAAEHEWGVRVTPSGDDAYALRVPFFSTDDANREDVLKLLKAQLHLVSGDGHVRVDGHDVVLEGRGPLEAKSSILVRGGVREREAFTAYGLANVDVFLNAASAMQADVLWYADMDGGKGNTCSMNAEYSIRVTTSAPKSLPDVERNAARDGYLLPVLCA